MSIGWMVGRVVLADAAGNLLLSRGMKGAGKTRFVWLGAGIGCMAFSFYSFLGLLSRANLSFVLPATALGYVVNTFGAAFLLKEKVSAQRWAGSLLVGIGVALVSIR